ncbi:mCG1042853 [Mus musculus]|nr:mCG1042853 [Mus musculus]
MGRNKKGPVSTRWKVKTQSQKLSSSLYLWAIKYMCVRTHAHTHACTPREGGDLSFSKK